MSYGFGLYVFVFHSLPPGGKGGLLSVGDIRDQWANRKLNREVLPPNLSDTSRVRQWKEPRAGGNNVSTLILSNISQETSTSGDLSL